MKILRSLRAQLLIPMFLGSLLVAAVVAVSAYWLAFSRAKTESRDRLVAITTVFSRSSFPLTQNVMQMLAELTDAYWIKMDSEQKIIEFAAPNTTSVLMEAFSSNRSRLNGVKVVDQVSGEAAISFEGLVYSGVLLKDQGSRLASSTAQSYDLLVMIDDARQDRAVSQAALPPLLTGFATILLIGSLSFMSSERLVKRIAGLQRQVDRIASSNLEIPLANERQDEIDKLGNALRAMSDRLDQMWVALRRNHTQQVINQIASGLAHNLRNTLTGARLAVELIARDSELEDASRFHKIVTSQSQQNPALRVAINQILFAEQYIQRLLSMAKGHEQVPANPMLILDALNSLRDGLNNTASHRAVEIAWELDSRLGQSWVSSGSALLSAVSNLVWNAMESAKKVQVAAVYIAGDQLDHGECRIDILDDGSGPPAEVRQSMFEPFVSSKKEGIGLGLSLVRQASELLNGSVDWRRCDNKTVFTLRFPTLASSHDR